MLVENVYGYNDEVLVASVWHSGAPPYAVHQISNNQSKCCMTALKDIF